MCQEKKVDWGRVIIHFVIGSLFGMIVCAGLWVPGGLLKILATAILFGVLSAIFGDRFWTSIKTLWRWW